MPSLAESVDLSGRHSLILSYKLGFCAHSAPRFSPAEFDQPPNKSDYGHVGFSTHSSGYRVNQALSQFWKFARRGGLRFSCAWLRTKLVNWSSTAPPESSTQK